MRHVTDLHRLLSFTAMVALTTLAGCNGKPALPEAPDAMRAAGYSRAPQIIEVAQAGSNMFVVTGQTIPDARVRFGYDGNRAIGVTSDSKGRFRAELPAGPQGGLYDLSTEDGGRLMYAEGRLFIPPLAPQKAVLMRAGSPSLALFNDDTEVAVLDYDAAGALAISGRVTPSAAVEVILNGDIWRTTSDDRGYYNATTQIEPPLKTETPNSLTLVVGEKQIKRDFTDVLPAGNEDAISRVGEGWRVAWKLPGGGMQTTLVF
ncbi:hypothetical protein [Asticcacaulis sp. MM231]|uniref:hypothetical protein n=1 Tax=Asticcacaulis sp. MM231 TaxID=3157666 RepID=UPI0032D5A8EC